MNSSVKSLRDALQRLVDAVGELPETAQGWKQGAELNAAYADAVDLLGCCLDRSPGGTGYECELPHGHEGRHRAAIGSKLGEVDW